ncbi:NADP-dependent oxidoreductase [Haliangium sp.]|uniref:NADP-dependent oxidoreductase n=1 Tax=Haliangium sp. TaxID=2663208 RepID=UPI003D0B675D
MSEQRINQSWRLARRPVGPLREGDLSWHEEPVGELADGQVLTRVVYLSIDPTNRIWMSDMPQYMEPVQIGDVMRGMAVGVVEESKNPLFQAGDLVNGVLGWQRYAVSDGSDLTKLPPVPVPFESFMTVLNHIGATAYFGLLEIGKPKAGETVVVSAAAGAVGSLVGQIAKIQGCRVVGIAGSEDKCRWITDELGFDAAIDYKREDVPTALDQHCPDGIDVYFDNVGGAILDAVLPRLNLFARVPLCGLISVYNATEPVPGPYNYGSILMKRARVEGFIVLDYIPRLDEAFEKLGAWMAAGKLRYRLDLFEGLERAPAAIEHMFAGGNIGKLAVKVSDEPQR